MFISTWKESETKTGKTKYFTKLNNKWLSVVILDNNKLFIIYDNEKVKNNFVWNETRKNNILDQVLFFIKQKYNIGLVNSFIKLLENGKNEQLKFGDGYEF